MTTFGSGLATGTVAATSSPLPITLAGTTVRVRDSASNERLAPLCFVSPTQVNCQIPAGTATGAATITSGDGAITSGTTQIAPVALMAKGRLYDEDEKVESHFCDPAGGGGGIVHE